MYIIYISIAGERVPVEEVIEDRREQLLRIYTKYVIYPGVYILMVNFESRQAEHCF